MEPLEIYDAINNKIIRVFVSTEVAEKCRTDTEFAHDLFNNLQDQVIEEGCAVEIQTIKTEQENEDSEPAEGEESVVEERIDKEIWTRHDTLKLIKVYRKLKDAFAEPKQKKVVWAMIAAELTQYNIFKTGAKCAEKWKNLIRTYRIANEKPTAPTRFQYYRELKDIFENTEEAISDSETDEKEANVAESTDAAELKESFAEEVTEKESWSRHETLVFLKVFQSLKHMKLNFSKERHFWSLVSAKLAKENVHKAQEKCSAKWKNLLRSYKRTLEKDGVSTRFQYFKEVNDVLNDIELETSDDFAEDVEKLDDPEQIKMILEEAEMENSKDPMLWSVAETLKLIEVYRQHRSQFKNCSSRRTVWNTISSELSSQGVHRDSEKCESKWHNLVRSYRKCESRGNSPKFYFYDLMSEVLNEEPPTDTNHQQSPDYAENSAEAVNPDLADDTLYEKIIIQTESDSNENENHWSFSETYALLKAYGRFKKKYKDSIDSQMWDEVSKELNATGVHKSAEGCEKKWKKLFSVYKIHKLNRTGPGRFQFYQEIDDIVKDEVESEDEGETVGPSKRCKCSERRMIEKQNRHIERMQLLKRKLDLEERKVEAFESYVKQLKGAG